MSRKKKEKDDEVPTLKLEFIPMVAQAQAVKGKQEAKYRDPENPFHPWSGRGPRPKWIRKYIEEGHDLETFRI